MYILLFTFLILPFSPLPLQLKLKNKPNSEILPPISHASLKLNVNDMTCSYVSDSKSIDSSHHSLHHLPLSQRPKLLHPPILQNDTRAPLTLQFDVVLKKELEHSDSQGGNEGLLETITEHTVKKVKEMNFADGKAAEARGQCYDIPDPEGSNISLLLGATCGWTPNTDLGTMLNYCDRVVHDRKNEDNSSEWRSKVGKLLQDGYNGGTIVMPPSPKKCRIHVFSKP